MSAGAGTGQVDGNLSGASTWSRRRRPPPARSSVAIRDVRLLRRFETSLSCRTRRRTVGRSIPISSGGSQRKIGKAQALAALQRGFVRQNAGAGDVCRLNGVRAGIALLDERGNELMNKMRV